MTSLITPAIIRLSISWEEYYTTAKRYVESVDKPERYRDEKMLRYTTENLRRMAYVLDTINIGSKLYNLLTAIDTDLIWLVLTEPWCGDASQVVPALHTIASCSERITFRILLSDNHPEVLDTYLTNGGRSIPKLICLRADTLEQLGTWGPRPAGLQSIVIANKDNPDMGFGEKVRMVHDWYAQDKTISIQDEFIDLIRTWTAK